MEVPWEVRPTISHPFEWSTKGSLSKLKVSVVSLNGTSPSLYLSLVLQIDFHVELPKASYSRNKYIPKVKRIYL